MENASSFILLKGYHHVVMLEANLGKAKIMLGFFPVSSAFSKTLAFYTEFCCNL